MIEEAYCNPEIAELLKEKGMPKKCFTHYIQKNNSDGTSEAITTCTHQMAMKWLRKVHNIFICIIPSEVGAGVMDYTYVLYKIDAKNFYFENLGIQGRAKNISEISYEEAVEAAIQFSLKNLI